MRYPICLLAALAAPAAAASRTPDAQLADMLRGRTAEAPVDCIDPHDAQGVRVIEGTAIVYDMGGRLYVNRLQDGAARLRRDDILVQHIDGGQLCRIDAVTLLDPATRAQRGFVVLGAFTPYRRAK